MRFHELKLEDIVHSNGIIYVKLLKALYGLRESSKLWYDTIRNILISDEYQQMTSDPCVFIKRRNEEEFIILLLYVDDFLVVSKDDLFSVSLVALLEAQFGTLAKQEGNKISFLSMLIESEDGTISLSQTNYLSKIVEDFEQHDQLYHVDCPSTDGLFADTTGHDPPCDKTRFLSILMSLMYAATRTRPDILKEITFLATRINQPLLSDWKKLVRIISYLKCHPNKALRFTERINHNLEIYADASFKVHNDTSGHTGIIIKLFGNIIFFKSGKQKIVTKSSTEAELVALDDAATYAVWISELLDELNIIYNIPVIIYQDNQSTMIMANAGKGNFKRTKHISNRYFWIKQFLDSGEIKLIYLPTGDMLADLLTKPLTGSAFRDSIIKIFNG